MYDLTLKPSGSVVNVEIKGRTTGTTWTSTLQKKPHDLDEVPPVAVRPKGRKIDYVDIFWKKYRVSLQFTHP